MKTFDHAELLEILTKLHRLYPEWRFGQLIANIAGWADCDIWGIEDEVLLEAAQAHLESVQKRGQEIRT